MQTGDQDQAEDRDDLLAYLRHAYERLDLSPPEQLLFDAHVIGALSWSVPTADWADAIDRAEAWTRQHRARPL